jgi:hypothetical protein
MKSEKYWEQGLVSYPKILQQCSYIALTAVDIVRSGKSTEWRHVPAS